MKIAPSRQLIGPALVGLVLIALYWPVFIWLVGAWLDNPYYSHGFLILPVSAFIAWTKRKGLVPAKPYMAGVAVLVVGLAIYVAGFAWRIHWLWAFSFLIVAFGLLLYLRGVKAARLMLFPIGFLIFMIPLPYLDSLAVPLQSIAASGSAAVVQAVGIPVTRTGAEIQLPEATFTVGIPCSGMNTLISLLALVMLLLYFLKAPLYKKAILFFLAFPIAIVANIVRIVLILVIAYFLGAGAAMTFFHGFSSLLLFLVALLLLFLLSRLFGGSFRSTVEPRS